jgi:acetolactate synthase-1/2/3 large subunit
MAGTHRAADVIVERLLAHRVGQVFTVAGESYLDVLDAFYGARDSITLITCRHEAAAANMAEAAAKLTGAPGVAFVTRGPGLTHASIGVHTAMQDATPLVLFVGEISREDRYRHAFQEVSLVQTFADLAKGVLQIDSAARAAELVDRAFQWAASGRPGPVVVGLPEDVLGEACAHEPHPPGAAPAQGVDAASLAAIAQELQAARRPLVWVGGGQWSPADLAALRDCVRAWDLPVITGFRRKDLYPNADEHYAGELGFGANPRLVQRLRDADRILVLGAALGDVETGGYQWLDRATTGSRVLHVHPDGGTLGAVFPVRVAAQSRPGALAAALRAHAPAGGPAAWSGWTQSARADQRAFMEGVAVTGAVNLSAVFRHLRASLPDTAVVTNGAGNYAAWLHRFYSHDQPRTQLAPGSGAMGYAVPAAVAAKIVLPEREVVCVAGDGCFLMSAQELATVSALGLKILFIVVNNGTYGTIRMHQESRFPGRPIGTALSNPSFTGLARSFGLAAWRVTTTEEFPGVLAAARSDAGPALIELETSIEDIAPGRRLTPAG